jgi:hypothetical protein
LKIEEKIVPPPDLNLVKNARAQLHGMPPKAETRPPIYPAKSLYSQSYTG